jgi:hypothetical protein
MVARYEEVDLLRGGIDANAPTKGAFALNMLHRRGAWEVREGFGQLAQYDTSFTKNITPASVPWGYQKHLGSHLMHTNFGHDQIVSAFMARVHTGNHDDKTTVSKIFCISIYDITTGERWEEAVYRTTSQNDKEIIPMYKWYGTYETDRDSDRASFVSASEDPFYFEEMNDILYMGNAKTGTLAYIPSSFSGNVHKSIDGSNHHEWHEMALSESSILLRAFPVDGIFTDAFTYFSQSTLPHATDVAAVSNRLAYASGRQVYLSDIGFTTSIMSNNFFVVPSEESITAMVEHHGNLLIFTRNETWHYQIPIGQNIVSTGALRRISDHIGCSGVAAVTKAGGAIVWSDRNGVYSISSSLQIEDISAGIKPFFTDHITNPYTSFYLDNGGTDLTATDQPNTVLKHDESFVNLAYFPRLQSIILTVPEENISMVLTDGHWSMWTYESVAFITARTDPDEAHPGITRNIEAPWFVENGDELYLIGSLDQESFTDDSLDMDGGDTINDHVRSTSYYIMQYGRGGATDRSVKNEDFRTLAGKYETQIIAGAGGNLISNSCFILDKWIPVPEGYVFPGANGHAGGLHDGEVAGVDWFLVPVYIVNNPNFITGLDYIRLVIGFDSSNWQPVFRDSGGADPAELDFFVPPARVSSVAGYAPGAPVLNTREVECHVSGGGGASVNGNEIRITYTGTGAGGGWSASPRIDVPPLRKEPILYLPMKPRGSGNVSGMSLEVTASGIDETVNTLGVPLIANAIVWDQWRVDDRHSANDVAQPVDWGYQSAQVENENGTRMKLRGIWVRLLSHGQGTAKLIPLWFWNLFNTVVGTDRKEWMAQTLDYGRNSTDIPAVEEAVGVRTIRTRWMNSSDVLEYKVFGDTDTRWGTSSNTAAGNILVSDEEVSDIDISEGGKCNSFSWMVFGHHQNRAEKTIIERITAKFRSLETGRRRRGH